MNNKINKELIIKTAFKEWGKNGFRNPSLKKISDKLKLTKPALYRHFKNKNDLIKEMKEYFIKEYYKTSNNFIIESEKSNDLKIIIKLYVEKHFTFFSKNHYYFFFFLFFVIKDEYFQKNIMHDILNNENIIFVNAVKRNNILWAESNNIELLKRFIYSTGIFYLIFKFQSFNTKIIKSFNDEESDIIVNDIIHIILNGFGTENSNDEINFQIIEKHSIVKRDEIPKRDKIINAVAEVIAEEGIWNTTISKIANKLGIVKSSLYFYFKNKNEMLKNTIKDEILKNDKLIRSKIYAADIFEEKLYSFITIFSSFLAIDKNLRRIFDWMHQQGFDLKFINNLDKIDLYDKNIIEEGINNNLIESYKFDKDFISGYLKIQIIKEVYYSELLKKDINIINIRNIYKLFLKGIKEVIK